MTAGTCKKFFYAAVAHVALMLAALSPAMAATAQWDVDQLMHTLAKAHAGQATFVEKKYVAVLERPVESSGELSFTAPNRLEKKTLKPKPETMLVDGDLLVIERGRQKHRLQLQDYPELAGFIDSIRGTLAGDRKALERTFRLTLTGDAQRWILTLAPHDAGVAQSVQQVRIAGSRDNVRSIDILQTDGDRSSMTIERVTPQ